MDPESRYSSLEKKKNKNEITHSKVTSYVSPRAQTQKDNNAFKFPIKNEMKKKAKIYKNNEKVIDEIHDNRDLFKEFSEKLNKNIGKQTNFTTLLNHFNIDQLHYNRNIFYQKYMVSNGISL